MRASLQTAIGLARASSKNFPVVRRSLVRPKTGIFGLVRTVLLPYLFIHATQRLRCRMLPFARLWQTRIAKYEHETKQNTIVGLRSIPV